MPVTFDLNIVGAANAISGKAVKAIVNAAGELMQESTPRTPFRKGELRSKRRVTPLKNGARMDWLARHAAVQNRGQRAGARPFTNYTTPGTGKDFAKIDPAKALARVLRLLK